MTLVRAARDGDTACHIVNDLALLTGGPARAVCGVLGYRWSISPTAWARLPECGYCHDREATREAEWDRTVSRD